MVTTTLSKLHSPKVKKTEDAISEEYHRILEESKKAQNRKSGVLKLGTGRELRPAQQVGGVNCRNAFVSFKDRKSVELAKETVTWKPWRSKESKLTHGNVAFFVLVVILFCNIYKYLIHISINTVFVLWNNQMIPRTWRHIWDRIWDVGDSIEIVGWWTMERRSGGVLLV